MFHGLSPRLILLSLNPLHRALRNVTEFSFVVDGSLLTVLTSVKTFGRNHRFLRPIKRSSTHEQKAPQAVFGQSPRLILLSLNPLHRALRNVTEFSFVVDGDLFSEKDVYGFLGQSPRFLCNCTNTPPDSSLLFPKSRKKSHFFTKSKNMSYILYTSPGAMSIKMRFY